MTTGLVICGNGVRRWIVCRPVPILKSIVVRVPAGWASAARMAARSEPAVGAVLLPLSVVVRHHERGEHLAALQGLDRESPAQAPRRGGMPRSGVEAVAEQDEIQEVDII